MTDAQWTRLAEIVPEALARPADERAAYLDAACTDDTGAPDAALRAEAAALVTSAEAADASGALTSPVGARAPVPERVGPWRVTGVLGEGGMGVVYAAERADGAYERQVALKRLHPSLGADLAERLAAERHALARLEHPGIARLYDAGVDDAGAPYLVMERVDGAPLTTYADGAGLDARARAALFADVCDAVAYAHGRLVVHRDLKPSNVFVAPGEPPSVRLLDFGIAKLLGTDVPDSLAATLTRTQAAMTPSYAAPEQITRGEVTTATDVYALGVMLYELLAGTRPYSLVGTTAAEAERIVCETDPPLPSAAAPAARARALRGDLDTITMKALAKEPAHRYASAEALAADLRRHLDGLPVLARPATAGYRVRRFVRRHRLGVAAGVAVALALVAGASVALWQAREARAEAERATAVSDFVVGLLNAPNAEVDGRDVRVADLLDRAAADLDSAFTGGPATEATLRHTLGMTYRSLALYDEAERQLERALAIRLRLVGPAHPDVAEIYGSLGRLYNVRGQYAAADSVLRLALAIARRHPGPADKRLGYILNDLGNTQLELGDPAAAAVYWREALAIDERTLPEGHVDRLIAMENLALALYDGGDTTGGLGLMSRQVAMLREHHPDNDLTLGNSLANYGSLLYGAGRREDAARLQREAVERFRRRHGDRHPDVAFALSNLGSTLGALGQLEESERLLRESAAIYGSVFGEAYADHPDVGYPLVNLAKTLRDQRRYDEAEAAARRALAVFTTAFGADHPTTGRATTVLAEIAAAR